MATWRYWPLPSVFFKMPLIHELLRRRKKQRPTAVKIVNQLCNKKKFKQHFTKWCHLWKEYLFFFFFYQRQQVFVWMTSSLSCFCRAAKAILEWCETCHKLIWNMSLVDRELYISHLKFSVVRKGWNRFDFRSTGGVRSCLAFWLCFLRRICMCDCLGKKPHTTEPDVNNIQW